MSARHFLLIFLFGGFTSLPLFAQNPDEPKTGDELANELRNTPPAGDSSVSGVLKIRGRRERREIPVQTCIQVRGDSWEVVYATDPDEETVAEKFVAVHTIGETNRYYHARAKGSGEPLPELQPIGGTNLHVPFAGSDFWLSELGLEFLHWPVQRKLKGVMRLGQPCYVLESIHPEGGAVTKVKSYIHKESGGLLIAEAHDAKGKLIKEFSLGGSSFKKINGQMHLKKMKIVSPPSDSETTLEFELPEE